MSHKVAYQIGAGSYSNLAYLKSLGYIDATIVGHGTGPCTQKFASDCLAIGMTPICNGGNDSIPTCGPANAANCYQALANMGYQAAGGESTGAQEEIEAQNHIVFINYGGEGLNPNQDSFGSLGFRAGIGHGVISYIESYVASRAITYNETLAAMKHAYDVGCREVGVMIGAWEPVEAGTYLQFASDFEASGRHFAGFSLWNGISASMEGTAQLWANAIKQMQSQWPADMRDLKTRLAGGAAPPAEVPKESGMAYLLFD